jgi:hypothetical protein
VAVLNNIATVYMEQKKYKKSNSTFRALFKVCYLDTLQNKKARIIDNRFAYYKDNHLKGLALMNQAFSNQN